MALKKLAITAAVALTCLLSASAGAPPTVMFLPDKTWCQHNGFIQASERNGKTRYTEKYDEAFMMNSDLKNVIVQLNALMKENGLPAKDYSATSELDDEEEAEEELYESQDGATMEMTPYEMAMNKLRPDIIIKLGWDVSKVGFNYSLSYRLEALDSYSGKSVAQVTGETGTMKTTVPMAAALKNAANEHMSQFIARLQEYFDDIQTNGREITVACRVGNNGSDFNFNSEINGTELSTLITDWMNDNTVNHAYSTRSASRNRMSFEQVRIPFKDANGRVMQAKEFVDQLHRYLKTLGISGENTTKGLGSGRLYNLQQQ